MKRFHICFVSISIQDEQTMRVNCSCQWEYSPTIALAPQSLNQVYLAFVRSHYKEKLLQTPSQISGVMYVYGGRRSVMGLFLKDAASLLSKREKLEAGPDR